MLGILRTGRFGRAPGRLLPAVERALLAQRGHLFTWVPVAIGTGIGLYFSLPTEPAVADWAVVAALAGLVVAGARAFPEALAPLAMALVLAASGAALAAARSHLVAAPVLDFRYYGPIEGRIVEVDRSASEAVRLTLDRVVLEDMAPDRTPERLRVSLHGEQGWIDPAPGITVVLTGHLGPPSGPVEPGAFDFRRTAWFEGLGAVGYTRTPVLLSRPAEPGLDLAVGKLRASLSWWIRSRIPGDAGGYAAAVTTGDRSGLSASAAQAMRDSNLYHLVSISGMHMGMLVAFVFGLIRTGVALIPPLALRLSSKKIAALVALPAAVLYLALAGRSIPTERAFVMAAVALIAILLDRRALSLRAVSVAALIVLFFRPEALLNPGFQMSFAAVVALVAAFDLLRRHGPDRPNRWIAPALFLLFSSAVAGAATAPYAAAHFGRIAHYGILANLFAVPVMGLLVMPGAVLLAILGPIGLGAVPLLMVEVGSRWILWVAEQVAGLDGAVSMVVTPGPMVLPFLTAGALLLILWQGLVRLVGLVPMAVALILWVQTERPPLLVSDTGGLLGLMGPDGRALSRPTGDGFAATVWLENDGDMASQEAAAARPGVTQIAERIQAVDLGGLRLLAVRGKTALAALDDCGGAQVLIANMPDEAARPCLVFDEVRLRETGALAIGPDGAGGFLIVTVAEHAGDRPWTRSPFGEP